MLTNLQVLPGPLAVETRARKQLWPSGNVQEVRSCPNEGPANRLGQEAGADTAAKWDDGTRGALAELHLA
jgi:hypothetical protein